MRSRRAVLDSVFPVIKEIFLMEGKAAIKSMKAAGLMIAESS